MKTILVWILLSTSTGHPITHYQFGTQADCIQAGTKLSQYGKFHERYICESIKVVDEDSISMAVPTTAPDNPTQQQALDAAQQNVRGIDYNAQRNADYNTKKLEGLLKDYQPQDNPVE